MLNHIVIMGRLTRDPDYRTTAQGVSVCNFSVAVDRDYSAAGQDRETDFLDCVAWRKTAEFVSKYFQKGQLIVVSGRLTIRTWTDKDGNKRRSAEIVAENCYFGSTKSDAPKGGQPSAFSEAAYPETMAAIASYSQPVYVQPDFSELTGDDEQLPF